ncbi:MAG: DUF4124 domain-containing protein [Gammaproteobacteria bacterium]
MRVVYRPDMRQFCYCLLALIYSAAEAADIYRWTDSEGNVIYSDTPQLGAEKVTLRETTILPSAPVPEHQNASNTEKQGPVKYQSVVITRPTDEQTIRENIANVSVAIRLQPGLQTEHGHQLQLLFDGRGVEEPGRKTSFTLPTVDRGAHTLQTVILESNGRVVTRSAITTFFVHKQSVRRGAP